jgi:hypothetical protein
MIRKTAPLSAGPRRLDKRERLQGKLVVLGGGGFTPPSSQWWFLPSPHWVREVFVPSWLDLMEVRCPPTIRAVKFLFLPSFSVVADVLWQKTSRDFILICQIKFSQHVLKKIFAPTLVVS